MVLALICYSLVLLPLIYLSLMCSTLPLSISNFDRLVELHEDDDGSDDSGGGQPSYGKMMMAMEEVLWYHLY